MVEKAKDVVIRRSSFIKEGETIENDYEFVGKDLGKGTYGAVKKAIHKTSQVERAVKIIPRSKIKNWERFEMEVDILRKADHPNIIKLYEWYQDDKNVYLVTELCSGGELFDRIIDVGKFTEKQAAILFKQMLFALNYCHSRKICHRDLKPENFLFEGKSLTSSIKLIDFGLSKIYENEEVGVIKMKTRAGTPYYIAPEVIKGSYDVRCDMWSLGVILYILLCGYPPFYGNNDPEILKSVQKGEFEFDGEEWEGISIEAKDLICKLIAGPDKRLTAEQSIHHPWIKNMAMNAKAELGSKQIKMLRGFKGLQSLKKAVLTYLATQLSEKETQAMKKAFVAMDKNGDGMLSFEELKSGLKGIKDDDEIREIMEAIDVDKSGTIDYTEFIAATLDENVFLNEEKLMQAFNMFDKDRSGSISASELKAAIGGGHSDLEEEFWQEMIKEADTDGDGQIDKDEFFKMMYKFKDTIK